MSLFFDREKLFAGYRKEFGGLTQGQVDGITYILDSAEKDPLLKKVENLAAMLGTTKHETADTYKPIHEYGGRAYFIKRYGSQTRVGKMLGNDTPEEGAIYSGEGDVQLTGETNFEKAENALRLNYAEIVADFERRTGRKFDLTVGDQPDDHDDPKNAGDPAIAYAIMSFGMHTGMFTGKKLDDYNLNTEEGRRGSRRVINGQDKATLIAGYIKSWIKILKAAQVSAPQAPATVTSAITATTQPARSNSNDASQGQQTGPTYSDAGGQSPAPLPDAITVQQTRSVGVQTVEAQHAPGGLLDSIESRYTTYSARYPALIAAVMAAGSGAWAWLSGSSTHVVTTFFIVAGAIVAIYVIGRMVKEMMRDSGARRAEQQEKDRLLKIQLALIEAGADKSKDPVVLLPPPAQLPAEADPGTPPT
jgi:putative chitinase